MARRTRRSKLRGAERPPKYIENEHGAVWGEHHCVGSPPGKLKFARNVDESGWDLEPVYPDDYDPFGDDLDEVVQWQRIETTEERRRENLVCLAAHQQRTASHRGGR